MFPALPVAPDSTSLRMPLKPSIFTSAFTLSFAVMSIFPALPIPLVLALIRPPSVKDKEPAFKSILMFPALPSAPDSTLLSILELEEASLFSE